MADPTIYIPLSFVIENWPEDLIAMPDQFYEIGFSKFEIEASTTSYIGFNGSVLIDQEIALNLVSIPGLSLSIVNSDQTTEFEFNFSYFRDGFTVCLNNLSIALKIASELLKEVEPVGDAWVEVVDEDNNPVPFTITAEGIDLCLKSSDDLSIETDGQLPAFTFSPFMIANSGVVIDIQSLQLILSDADAGLLPETIDATWRGVFLDQATIHLPSELSDVLPSGITFDDAFIGSGGFCGSVILDLERDEDVSGYDENKAKTIFGFGFTLQYLKIEFTQNALTASTIKGFLKVPFFDEILEIEVGLTNDGDFTVSLGSDSGLLTLEKDGVISIEVSSLAFSTEDEVFSLTLTGSVTPLLAEIDWPSFELNGLTISSDGKVKVDGGWI